MILKLVSVAVLILLTAVFVATEFAIVRIRPSRVDQMVLERKKNALAVQRLIGNLDGYLSACQLGITITALGLGWLGEPTVQSLLNPLFGRLGFGETAGHALSLGIAFAAITYFHVVLGELAPKTLAIQKAEQIAVLIAPIMIYFHRIMYPFIWLLNGSANGMVKLFGMKTASEHEEAHSEEEIRIILSESYEKGKINPTEFGYVDRIFNFDELLAREIMVPRTDIVVLYEHESLEEHLSVVREEPFTRFLVARESKDDIVGFINTKQFFLRYVADPAFDFRSIIQPVLTVPSATPVKKLLPRMQQERIHIALLLDEYGGTAGLVTIEDILEQIVGEIRDEFDADEKRPIEPLGGNRYLVEGVTPVEEVNRLLGARLKHDSVDSIGGWLYALQPELEKGMAWNHEELTFIVRERENHRIRKIEIVNRAAPAPDLRLVEQDPPRTH
ncbi:hemolysin family protein [Cohnella candidum]|uniref:HlyC/CorC family transporter n=1 Tax=Cohnella candidum TaxID=2674991 RepID=A0A3G3JVR8_9BACL|nr:hemolysin family protein [Cohnella candidum]AYQ72274.1 HlyC/CorC family transporter [Cohnella candidum]